MFKFSATIANDENVIKQVFPLALVVYKKLQSAESLPEIQRALSE